GDGPAPARGKRGRGPGCHRPLPCEVRAVSDQAPSMRIPDSERDRVAQLLQEHFAQGRLDHEEFTERLSSAYKSRTETELARVTEDLPERDLAELRSADRAPEEVSVPPMSWRDPALLIPWFLWGGVNLLC